MSAPIRLELPFPPTVNNLFINGRTGKGRFMSPAYRAWKDEAGKLAKAQIGGRRIAGPYTLSVALVRPDRRARDASNYLKAVEDLLVWLNITDDDSNCAKISAEWVKIGPPCFVIVFPYVEEE